LGDQSEHCYGEEETVRKETFLTTLDETKSAQKVNQWNVMFKKLVIVYLIKKFPRLADKLINKQDCITQSKYFTGCVTSNILFPIFSSVFRKES